MTTPAAPKPKSAVDEANESLFELFDCSIPTKRGEEPSVTATRPVAVRSDIPRGPQGRPLYDL